MKLLSNDPVTNEQLRDVSMPQVRAALPVLIRVARAAEAYRDALGCAAPPAHWMDLEDELNAALEALEGVSI